MIGQVIIGSHDVSNFVVAESYQMDSEATYESWLDGNKMQHRSGNVEKVNGNFNVVLCANTGCTLAQFVQYMEDATTDGITYAAVYVTNKGTVEAIDCFYKLTSEEHILLADGTFLDVVNVELTER